MDLRMLDVHGIMSSCVDIVGRGLVSIVLRCVFWVSFVGYLYVILWARYTQRGVVMGVFVSGVACKLDLRIVKNLDSGA